MQKTGKLELTWVGKYDDKVIESRILMEAVDKSYGDLSSENMLIHGDNLIALQALQQDFSGRIKCIYIDPPYNTGNAFDYYDDGLVESYKAKTNIAQRTTCRRRVNLDSD